MNYRGIPPERAGIESALFRVVELDKRNGTTVCSKRGRMKHSRHWRNCKGNILVPSEAA